MNEIIIILLLYFYFKGKIFKMDIYDMLDYESKLICDAMYAQTKLSNLKNIHDRGVHMLLNNYASKVDDELLNDYVSIVKEKYNLCRTILLNQSNTLNTAYLN
jgi:hypothetical protein